MKKLFIFFVLSLILSCQEEGILTKGGSTVVIQPGAVSQYQGVFEPTSGIAVTGKSKIYLENGQYQLQLENFSITGGPDLKVYLSKAATPTEFVNLGNLTSQTVYSIPSSVAISTYSHVLIHCQQYNHLFAIAPLSQN